MAMYYIFNNMAGTGVGNYCMKATSVASWAVVMFVVLTVATISSASGQTGPSYDLACNLFTSCATCVSSETSFNCTWCENIRKCSDGVDRHRQRWLDSRCGQPENFINETTQCPGYTTAFRTERPTVTQTLPSTEKPTSGQKVATEQPKPRKDDYCNGIECQNGGVCYEGFCNCPTDYAGARCQKYVVRHCEAIHCQNGGTCKEGITTHVCDCMQGYSGLYCDEGITASKQGSGRGLTVGAIVCIILISLLVCCLLVWSVYAYKNPTSSSGLFIIEAKHRLKSRGRGSNGVKYKYHQQVDSNHVEIQL